VVFPLWPRRVAAAQIFVPRLSDSSDSCVNGFGRTREQRVGKARRNLKPQNSPILKPAMKIKTLLTLLTTAALSLNVAFAAEDDTPLAKEMKTVNKSLRTLKRQVSDSSKKSENLELLATIKKSLDAAMKLEPAKTKDQPAAQKAAYVENYKKQMTDLEKTFGEVEAAVKADKPDDAKKLFEKLSEEKEKGHKDFGADDDK
jgi:hypothetical protein